MHEGAVCREIMDIVDRSARENGIRKVHEIVLAVGPWAGIHTDQLNFYFEILRKGTSMSEAVIRVEKEEGLNGSSQMYIKNYRGE
jgi:Zn finger protein HypA/HybF involved in hydrogenase expression